jgi:hypothetical protein
MKGRIVTNQNDRLKTIEFGEKSLKNPWLMLAFICVIAAIQPD